MRLLQPCVNFIEEADKALLLDVPVREAICDLAHAQFKYCAFSMLLGAPRIDLDVVQDSTQLPHCHITDFERSHEALESRRVVRSPVVSLRDIESDPLCKRRVRQDNSNTGP